MQSKTSPDRTVLVVYYSLSGFTKKIANEIAQVLPCSTVLEEIKEIKPRRGWWGYVRSCYEALRGKRPKIREVEAQIADYDLVIVGTPIWAGHMASPVRTFLLAFKDQFKDTACFCTSGGSGSTETLEEMAGLCEADRMAKLSLTDNEITKGDHQDKVDRFITEIAHQFSTNDEQRSNLHLQSNILS